jgi:hypothetical protein
LFARTFKRRSHSAARYARADDPPGKPVLRLPFFFITTTWNSGQLVFTGLLGAAGLISITDPLYYKWLAPRRWLFLALHTLTLFAALLTALPIILHLTTAQSFKLALVAAMVCRSRAWPAALINNWRRGAGPGAGDPGGGGGGWLLRSWVPPATLWMTEVAISTEVLNRQPGDRWRKSAPAASAQAACTPTPRSMPRAAE